MVTMAWTVPIVAETQLSTSAKTAEMMPQTVA